MSFFNSLLISVLLAPIFPDADPGFGANNSCQSLQVSYKVMAAKPGNFDVAVESKTGVAPIQYLFYSEAGDVLSSGLAKSELKGISKGKYYCIVRDAKNCRETIEIEIK